MKKKGKSYSCKNKNKPVTTGEFINFFAGADDINRLPSDRMGAILVNTPRSMRTEAACRYTSKLIRKSGAALVMLDSGGFQVLNMQQKGGKVTFDPSHPLIFRKSELNISTEHIIEADRKFRPTIVTGLDCPVLKTSDPREQRREFFRKLEQNLAWMGEISSLHRIYKCESDLYLPVQCYTLDQFEYIADELQDLEFDGLSLPTRNMTPEKITQFLLRFHQLGVRKVHLLGVSNFSGISLAAYFARNVFERCSVDGASWRVWAQFRKYLDPVNLLTVDVGDRKRSKRSIRRDRPCDCKACKGFTTMADVKKIKGYNRAVFLMKHNFHVLNQLGRDCFLNAQNPDAFESFLRGRVGSRTKDIEAVMRSVDHIHGYFDGTAAPHETPSYCFNTLHLNHRYGLQIGDIL